MNLRNAENYTIGIDLGTGSVGWAVVDENGKPYTMKGMPTMGSRLFDPADSAAKTRLKRGSRRRYQRRRQRIEFLQQIFLPAMSDVDPTFFVRLRESSLVRDDKGDAFAADKLHALFNGSDFTESEYYKRFPTIWHLRDYLANADGSEDLRLVYLALHNIVKYRGNFLHEDETNLKASNANAESAAFDLCESLQEYCERLSEALDLELSCDPDAEAIKSALENNRLRAADVIDLIVDALHLDNRGMAKGVASACLGRKAEFSNVFLDVEKQEGTNFALSDDEKVEAFEALCSDDGAPLFEAIKKAYSAHVLSGLLRGHTSLSKAMIASYERHRNDLEDTKGLIRDYCGLSVYNDIFRGKKITLKNVDASGKKIRSCSYDTNNLRSPSYTAYVLGDSLANRKGCTQEELCKEVRSLLDKHPEAKGDGRYKRIEPRLNSDDGIFLAKQKTRANGSIPYQLHLEEFEAILDRQGEHYPFLKENKEVLVKMLSSRIPYYVGPLNAGADPNGPFPKNTMDPSRKFAWSVRKPGMEQTKAYPWNIDEVIDVDETAERFIQRMTGTCTYLMGEPVLPKCSLLYEEFCVLNELNGARKSENGGDFFRFDQADREGIIEDIFKRQRSVRYKTVEKWLCRNNNSVSAEVKSGQGEAGFESKLGSYNDFCGFLGVESLEDRACPLSIEEIEQIILWNTVFEDRAILKRKIVGSYGDRLSEQQIAKIVKKRYTGWGRLSRKFLCGIKVETPFGAKGIIDILREGNPITGHHYETMILMEVLAEKKFGFQESIDRINKEYIDENSLILSAEDMQGSPALRRSINQAMRIIEEIVHIAGKAPARICIEETRDDDFNKKGRRTESRYEALRNASNAFEADTKKYDKELAKQLKDNKEKLNDERLVLYFAQRGKSLYSQRPLDINRLQDYQVDHIIPQAYVKDDSLDNKALVLQEENQRKLDSLLLDSGLISRNYAWWDELYRANLISYKKFRNLTCVYIGDRRLSGFIARQLVETSQIVKFTRQLCEARYPETETITVKASLSHELRERCGLPKVRELNDYHHAHDAYLACQAGRFVGIRYPQWQDGFSLQLIRDYVKSLGNEYRKNKFTPGRSGFIADSFMRDGVNKQTGEVWEASQEIAQMKKVFSYPKVFLSRMTFEQTGAFWDETVYSPKGKNPEGLAPLKGFGTDHVLNPENYGGYNKVQQSYFFIFMAKDKNGNTKYFFEGIPVHFASSIKSNPDLLREYAEAIANGKKCSDAVVLRKKVPLRQAFELNGDRFFLYGSASGGRNEIRSAVQMAANPAFSALMKMVLENADSVDEDKYTACFYALDERLAKVNSMLHTGLSLMDGAETFEKLTSEEKSALLKNVLMVSCGDSQGCDLRAIKGGKKAAYLRTNLASKMESIVWIDQSVTGMREKRTTLQDMLNGV